MAKKEIRIKSIPDKMKREVENVAAHKGISQSSMLKPVIQEFLDKQPDRYKEKYADY